MCGMLSWILAGAEYCRFPPRKHAVIATTACFRGGRCRVAVPPSDPRKHATPQWSAILTAAVFAALANSYSICAAEPAVARLTLANVPAPSPIRPDEPFSKDFSPERAARYLDIAALNWMKTKSCTACHTMTPYMMARPALAAVLPPAPEVRQFFEEVATKRREAMPSYTCKDVDGAVAIVVAAALAFNDRTSTGKLHPATRQALDQMWALQHADGGWTWPFRDTPPLKSTEHYFVTFAALGAGLAPEGYAKTAASRKGLEGVRKFLKAHPATGLHEKAMLLWAGSHVDGLMVEQQRKQTLTELLAAQRPDGGWSMASLIANGNDPKQQAEKAKKLRAEKGFGTEFLVYAGRDETYKSSLASDGYATGLVVYVARQAGVPAADQRLQRGIAWLKSHQRVSGRWFTPSQAWHTQNLICHAGTAYAVMALHACGEIPAKSSKTPAE